MLTTVLGLDAEGWQAVAALVGLPLVAGSLLVVSYQIARETRAERARVYQEIAAAMFEIDRIFIERPELRKYFYRGVSPDPDTVEYERVLALAELFVDFMDNLVQQDDRLERELVEYWCGYFRDIYRNSPAIREFWQEHCHWYAPELYEVLGMPPREDLPRDESPSQLVELGGASRPSV